MLGKVAPWVLPRTPKKVLTHKKNRDHIRSNMRVHSPMAATAGHEASPLFSFRSAAPVNDLFQALGIVGERRAPRASVKREDVHLRATINKTNEFSLAWNLRGHREMRPHVRGVVMCSFTSTLRTTLESLAPDFTCARLANAVLLRLTGVGLMGSRNKSGSVSTCAARRKTRGNSRSSQSTSVASLPWSHKWHSFR